jgi:hypothetical protein
MHGELEGNVGGNSCGPFKAFCYCPYERVRMTGQNIRKGVLQSKFKMGNFHINIRKYLS